MTSLSEIQEVNEAAERFMASRSEKFECPGRIKLGDQIIKCTSGDHEEAHRSIWHSWYDDMEGAFREGVRTEFDNSERAERVQFNGGGMRDSQEGKPRFDLLVPLEIPFDKQYLTRVARLMARGADHYEDRNWERFDDEEALNRAKASAFRHFMQWLTGEDDEDHAASIFFNVMAVEYIKEKLNSES